MNPYEYATICFVLVLMAFAIGQIFQLPKNAPEIKIPDWAYQSAARQILRQLDNIGPGTYEAEIYDNDWTLFIEAFVDDVSEDEHRRKIACGLSCYRIEDEDCEPLMSDFDVERFEKTVREL